MRWPVWICCLLPALLALGACGGSDENQGDERAVRAAIEGALTSEDPSACTAPYTRAFLDQGSFGLRGLADEYVRFCRANIAELAASEATVSGVRVDGDRAQADFQATGGAYPVRAASVELRRTGEAGWRLDRLTALRLDRDQFARQQAGVARLADERVPVRAAACFARRLERVSDATLEQGIVEARAAVLADPLLVCAIRPELRAAGLSSRRAGCVIERLRRDREGFARRLLARTAAAERELDRAFTRAGRACA